MQSIAIFGGTFDPIHIGHIQTSIAIQTYFNFDSYYFLPCKNPTIKPPAFATNQQRIDMLKLAISKYPNFDIDLREIERSSPSYMVETLQSFRMQYENASITLIMGYDAFLSLPQWHQWTRIITLANLLVINREYYVHSPIPEPIQELQKQHKNDTADMLLNSTSGVICYFNAGNYLTSSTDIREKIRQHHEVKNELPKDVYEYIKLWELYQ